MPVKITIEANVLRPCPFCGGTDFRVQRSQFSWYVWCLGCDAFGPSAQLQEQAIERWNTRKEEK